MISKLLTESSTEVQFYLQTQIDYLKLIGTEKVVKICSLLLSNLILTIIFSSLLLFLSLSAAIYIGHMMDGVHLGFLIIAGFYAFVGTLLMVFKKHMITEPILRKVIKTLFEEEDRINPDTQSNEIKSQNISSN